MRLREMMSVRGSAVADNFAKDFSVAFPRVIESFERKHGCAFAKGKAIAMRIEWAALRGRKGLKRIKAGKNHLAESVIAAGEHAARVAAPEEVAGVANGVCAGSAGVRDDGDWAGESEGVKNVRGLTLSLIMLDAGCLAPMVSRGVDGLAIVGFAQAHAAAGRSENERQIFGWFPAGLPPGFVSGENEQSRGAVHAADLTRRKACGGERVRQFGLRGHFHALTGDVKKRHGTDGIFAEAKTFRVVFPTDSQSGYDARAGNDDARLVGR